MVTSARRTPAGRREQSGTPPARRLRGVPAADR